MEKFYTNSIQSLLLACAVLVFATKSNVVLAQEKDKAISDSSSAFKQGHQIIYLDNVSQKEIIRSQKELQSWGPEIENKIKNIILSDEIKGHEMKYALRIITNALMNVSNFECDTKKPDSETYIKCKLLHTSLSLKNTLLSKDYSALDNEKVVLEIQQALELLNSCKSKCCD